MSDTDSFLWNGGTVGSWGTASNWIDLTTGSIAAAAPDYNSTATIGPGVTLLGDGEASSLTFLGDVTISGTIADYAATLISNGTVNLDLGTLTGNLTLEPGQTLSGMGVSGGVLIDNGTVNGDLTLGEPTIYSYILRPGQIISGTQVAGSLSGTGLVDVSVLALEEPVWSGALTFQLDGNATLNIEASIAAGNTIDLAGSANTIAINGELYITQRPVVTVGEYISVYYTYVGQEPTIAAPIIGFNATDSLEFVDEWQLGLTLTSVAFSDGTLSMMKGTTVEATVNLVGDYSADTFVLGAPLYGHQAITVESSAALCFVAGTLIGTPRGAVPVERLAAGDLVLTAGGKVRPISWLGVGRVLATRGRRNAATPVIVRKSALAPNVPHADLHVTKGHSLWIDGVLIPVEFLVNHRSIRWDDQAQEVSLYHIELETHDILLANGAPAESYRDDGNRWLFQNANTGWDQPPKPPCAPVLTGGPVVDAVWRRLLDRAEPRAAIPMTPDPDLHVRVDGVRVDATARTHDVDVFALPAAPRGVRVVSRAAAPQELGIARDPRCLGVAVRRVVVRQGTRFRVTDAGDRWLTNGFYPPESDGSIQWTDGDAGLPDEMFAGFAGPVELVIHTGGSTVYGADGGLRRIA